MSFLLYIFLMILDLSIPLDNKIWYLRVCICVGVGVCMSPGKHIPKCICLFWKSITHNHTIKNKTPQACDKRIVMHSERKKISVFVCTFHYNALAIHRLTLFHSVAHFCSLVFVIGRSSRFELFLLSTLYVHIYICCELCSFLSTVLVFVCLLKKIHLPLLAITHEDACCIRKLQFSSGWFQIGRCYERRILFCKQVEQNWMTEEESS